jgi:hypothetical protein
VKSTTQAAFPNISEVNDAMTISYFWTPQRLFHSLNKHKPHRPSFYF